MSTKNKLPEIEAKSLGEEETFTKLIFPDDRPDCCGTMKNARHRHCRIVGKRIKDHLCGKQATVTLDDQPYCDHHAGKFLLDLYLGRTREIPNG